MPSNVIWSIAAAFAGFALVGANPVAAAPAAGGTSSAPASASPSAEPPVAPPPAHFVMASHRAPAVAPPALLAQTIVPATPALAMRPLAAPPAVVAQGAIVRAVTPGGSQPGVLWVIAMGVVCCRMGARVLRVS